MAVFGFIKKQFIEVIEWPSQDDSTLAWKFPVADNEIKNEAQLTVREGQIAVFINEGQIADVFKPGLHTLSTRNLPVLTTLNAWKQGFNSPFKADVVFISTREFRNFKWGTPQPITIRDPDFGLVRVRAFGSFGLRVIDAKDFLRECAGIRDIYEKSTIEEIVRKVVIAKFTDSLAEMQVGAIDIATKYDELSDIVNQKICKSFDNFGIELTNFIIENVNMPEELQAAIDEQSKMNLMLKNENKFAKWQTLKSIPNAMENKGGGVGGLATDIAVGSALAGMVGNAMQSAGIGAQNSNQNSQPQINGETKFCSECGVKLPRNVKFCSECGHKF